MFFYFASRFVRSWLPSTFCTATFDWTELPWFPEAGNSTGAVAGTVAFTFCFAFAQTTSVFACSVVSSSVLMATGCSQPMISAAFFRAARSAVIKHLLPAAFFAQKFAATTEMQAIPRAQPRLTLRMHKILLEGRGKTRHLPSASDMKIHPWFLQRSDKATKNLASPGNQINHLRIPHTVPKLLFAWQNAKALVTKIPTQTKCKCTDGCCWVHMTSNDLRINEGQKEFIAFQLNQRSTYICVRMFICSHALLFTRTVWILLISLIKSR